LGGFDKGQQIRRKQRQCSVVVLWVACLIAAVIDQCLLDGRLKVGLFMHQATSLSSISSGTDSGSTTSCTLILPVTAWVIRAERYSWSFAIAASISVLTPSSSAVFPPRKRAMACCSGNGGRTVAALLIAS